MAALPASPFPAEFSAVGHAATGPGLYKLGYVTTDLDKAIETFTTQLGFVEFTRFSPSMDVTAGGQHGPAKLDCAFSTGRELVVELMQPLEGLVGIFREPLPQQGFAIAFHHLGVLVDDLAAVKEQLPVPPAWESWIPERMGVTYSRLPGAGHYVEHVEYRNDGGAFLASVRQPRP